MEIKDQLTGLLRKKAFDDAVRRLLDTHVDIEFELLRMDVERFKVVNEFFGEEMGDRLLRRLAECLQALYIPMAIMGRLHSDHFALVYPANRGYRANILRMLGEMSGTFIPEYTITIDCGVYRIVDRSIPVSVMCDRANMALHKAKGNYLLDCGEYDEALGRSLKREQQLINAMADALQTQQFQVWLQPKYDMSSEVVVGAEALVRWQHPEEGLISPADFIPLFERNGLILKLDEYIWEETCRILARWQQQGEKVLPVSVNLSRVDVHNPRLCEVLSGLVKKYALQPGLLQLEITESAYTDNAQQIITVTKQLQELGFTILMDDFGSGYSSLNMLKDVPVDILKLDLRFLSGADDQGRSGSILNSIVNMAKWLNIGVIAEGVETQEQAEFLRKIGCRMIQGYYYSRPVPVGEYETLLHNMKRAVMTPDSTLDDEEDMDIWNPFSQYSLLFNTQSCGIAVIERSAEGLELLRGNQGYDAMAGGVAGDLRVLPGLLADDAAVFHNLLDDCLHCSHETEALLRCMSQGHRLWLDVHARLIFQDGQRSLYYLYLHDVTNLQEKAGMLTELFEQFPAGIGIYELDKENRLFARYMSPAVLEFNGMTEKQFRQFQKDDTEVARFIGTEYEAGLKRKICEAWKQKERLDLSVPIQRADGIDWQVRLLSTIVKNYQGSLLCYTMFYHEPVSAGVDCK